MTWLDRAKRNFLIAQLTEHEALRACLFISSWIFLFEAADAGEI